MDKPKFYRPEQCEKLLENEKEVLQELEDLMLNCLGQAEKIEDGNVVEYLNHGVGRRLSVMRRAIKKIFDEFPPSTEHPLTADTVADIQLYLHAFIINLSGVFDNLAFAFVLRHGLKIRPHGVGLFSAETTKYLPEILRASLAEQQMVEWHAKYLKGYRDSLAHRIPLYIAPAVFNKDEAQLARELNLAWMDSLRAQDFAQIEEIEAKQSANGKPCFWFQGAFENEPAVPIQLHLQLLSDGRTVSHFGSLFFQHWHEVVRS